MEKRWRDGREGRGDGGKREVRKQVEKEVGVGGREGGGGGKRAVGKEVGEEERDKEGKEEKEAGGEKRDMEDIVEV